MSLAPRNPERLRELLDNLRLPNSPNAPTVVVYQNHIEGHFYNNPNILNTENSTLNVGDIGRMSHRGRPSIHQERSPLPTTPPPSEDAADADRRLPMMSDAPPEYRARDYDWFMPGRYFKIWAREGNDVDIEIHEKEYILLDTKNIEGPGLLVRRLPIEQCSHEGHRGSFNRTHVLLQNHDSAASRSSTTGGQSRRKTVYMDEEEDEVADHTFIELEHTYNIPFVKYKCIDYGVLTRSSLRELRAFYVNWLRYHWELD